MKKDLEEYRDLVNAEILKYFESVDNKYKNYNKYVSKVYDELVDLTLRGGKRLRPTILYYAFLASGGDINKKDDVVSLSIFIEIFESFLLIHDDIMDKDVIRRGGKTNHIANQEFAEENGLKDQQHYGVVMAMLAGDLATQMGYQIIGKSNFESQQKVAIVNYVSNKLSEVIFGQINDTILPQINDFVYQDIIDVYNFKTATYTFQIPCLVGSILAGKFDSLGEILAGYAESAGIAFQIRDDILGLFGEEEVTGKSNIGDIQEGKKTILVWKALQEANENQKLVINKFLGKEDISNEEADEFKKVIIETGGLKFAEEECKKYVDEAKMALEKLPDHDNEGWKFLNWIADYMLERKK